MASTISSDDVHAAASKLGVSMAEHEVPDYEKLLSNANNIFTRLLSMPDYHPPVNTDLYPRNKIHRPAPAENVLGVAWSHTFSVSGQLNNPNGILAGKTFCLKDNICVAGVPQVNGTNMVAPWVPHSDATVVTRILEAGGEIIGTATCENMSYSPASDTSAQGLVHNPYAEGYSAGGSSSGVGALVGSPRNLVDMGIGADQGGSVRIPAAMSGCVGLKATHGLIPYTGIVTSEAVMDHVGPICKTVMEVAAVLEVIAGRDGLDDRGCGAHAQGEVKYASNLKAWYDSTLQNLGPDKILSGMRIGILKESLESEFLQPAMREKVLSSADRLRSLGAKVEEVSMPSHVTGRDIWFGIRRLGGALSMLGSASGRKVYCLTPLLDDLYRMDQNKWDNTCTAVKSTIINGTHAMEKYPGLYAKCLNLAIRCKLRFKFCTTLSNNH